MKPATATAEIFVTFQFPGEHCWPGAPAEVAFLRTPHRHMFHAKASVPVGHNDRELEFILLKEALLKQVKALWPDRKFGTLSCESIAEVLGRWLVVTYELPWARVEVNEDGENGAVVTVPTGAEL